MRKMKKIASLMMALVMVMAMSVTAFAADGDYTITISNTTTDESYYAYQIFDATYVTGYAQGDEDGIAYTITGTSAWYAAVADSNLFDLAETSTSSIYVVTLKSGITATQIAEWAKAAIDSTDYNITADAGAASNGTGSSLTLDVPGPGYYYVSSSLGSTVTLTSAAPSATIIDKNQGPEGGLDKTVDDTTAQIGSVVTYTITANVPAYDGETKITNYTFTDTLSDGLTAPSANDVTVTIKDGSDNVVDTGSAVTVTVNEVTNTITVSYALTDISGYPADATITITYTATVNAKAAYANGNTVTQTWNNNSEGNTTTETVYTYGFKLVKVIKDTTTELSGAKFKLYTTENGTVPIKFSYDVTTDTYTVDPDGTVTEIEVGSAYIFGLDATTYYLEETKAPDGYNALTARQTVTVSTDGTSEAGGVLTITQTENVENGKGSSLPSTGGIGTTIFYIVGTVLVLGAAVVLITRRRMSSEA